MKVVRISTSGAAVVLALLGAGVALADPPPGSVECRDANSGELQVGRPQLGTGPTVYTDNVSTYAGVCGWAPGGNAQVNELSGALDGSQALVEVKTGNHDVDHLLGPGKISVWLEGGQGDDSCAPAGDQTYVGNDGNVVSRNLPTVYTDGLATHAGVCYGDAYVQVNEVSEALAGTEPLVEGQTGSEFVDSKLWGDGHTSYGPAGVWLNGGPESTQPSCAPEGDDRYVYSNGNNVTRDLPTVYTDNLERHVGICGGSGDDAHRVEVREPLNAVNDPTSVLVVE